MMDWVSRRVYVKLALDLMGLEVAYIDWDWPS